MRLRKLVNELLVISPFALILCITVEARTRVDYFIPFEYSDTLQKRICAYIEPVRSVESLVQDGTAKADPVELRKVGVAWRDLALLGFLKPLPPETPEDSMREGIKAQVQRAADELASALQCLSRRELEKGKFYEAACDATLAIEASEGIKFSDFHSVGMITVRQITSMMLLKDIATNLTDREKIEIASRLDGVRELEKPLAEAVLAQQRVWHFDPQTKGQLQKSDIELMLELAKAADSGTPSGWTDGLVARLKQACKGERKAEILPDFRFAWSAKRNEQKNWDALNKMLRA